MKATFLEIVEFSAPWDAQAKLITTATFIICIAIIYFTFRGKTFRGKPAGGLLRVIILVLLPGALLWAYLYHTSGYTLKGYNLVIKRPIGDINIKMKSVLDCRALTEEDMKNTTRSFGVGGLFGYSGKYHNPMVGDMTFYATSNKNMVLIHVNTGEAIVLSPDNAELMAKDITELSTPNN